MPLQLNLKQDRREDKLKKKNVAKRTYKQYLPYEQWAKLSSFLGNIIFLFFKVVFFFGQGRLPFWARLFSFLEQDLLFYTPPLFCILALRVFGDFLKNPFAIFPSALKWKQGWLCSKNHWNGFIWWISICALNVGLIARNRILSSNSRWLNFQKVAWWSRCNVSDRQFRTKP